MNPEPSDVCAGNDVEGNKNCRPTGRHEDHNRTDQGAGGRVERTQHPAQPLLFLAPAKCLPQGVTAIFSENLTDPEFQGSYRQRLTLSAFAVRLASDERVLCAGRNTGIMAVSTILALSVAVPASAAGSSTAPGDKTLVPVVLWALVGIGLAALAFGILYLLKKQLGGFPQPPSWIPPIDVMRSSDLPQDEPEEEHAAPAHEEKPSPAPPRDWRSFVS